MDAKQILKEQCIIALDTPDDDKLENILSAIQGHFSWVKVGMELFYAKGPSILEKLYSKNFKIFLDLKLHDIPQTIHNSILSLNRLPFELLTIHLQGGSHMIKAAADAIAKNNHGARLLGVSVLTSFDELTWRKTQSIPSSISKSIHTLVTQDCARELYGVVCSGHDIVNVRSLTKLKAVIPGIRWSAPAHDQARIMTPSMALKAGADHLVIGREITHASNIDNAIQSLREHLNEKF